jgi:hypothetical protein
MSDSLELSLKLYETSGKCHCSAGTIRLPVREATMLNILKIHHQLLYKPVKYTYYSTQ